MNHFNTTSFKLVIISILLLSSCSLKKPITCSFMGIQIGDSETSINKYLNTIKNSDETYANLDSMHNYFLYLKYAKIPNAGHHRYYKASFVYKQNGYYYSYSYLCGLQFVGGKLYSILVKSDNIDKLSTMVLASREKLHRDSLSWDKSEYFISRETTTESHQINYDPTGMIKPGTISLSFTHYDYYDVVSRDYYKYYGCDLMKVKIQKKYRETDNRGAVSEYYLPKSEEEILIYANKRQRLEREYWNKLNEEKWQLEKKAKEENKKQRYLYQHFK